MTTKNPIHAAAYVMCAAFLLAGCFSAKRSATNALNKVDEANRKLATNRIEQLDKAAVYIHGTGKALAAVTNRSTAVEVAYDLNSRAATIVGPPSFQDSLAIERVVEGALSGVAENQRKSAEILAKLDARVVELQGQLDRLQEKRVAAEENRDSKLLDYAAEADFGRKVKRWLWIGGLSVAGLFLAPFILQVLSVAFPMFAPLTQIFAGIVAFPGKLLVKAVPAVRKSLGVVEEEAHQRVSVAATQVSKAIEEWKKKDRTAFETNLAPYLRDKTDEASRNTIRELKMT